MTSAGRDFSKLKTHLSIDNHRKVCYNITIDINKDSPKRLHLEITFIIILIYPF